MTVDEYVATLKPITDWSTVKEGDKIFNRTSLDVCAYDTFISYDEKFDEVWYRNIDGEKWNGPGKNYWYYSDRKFEHCKITHKMIRNGILNGKIKLGISNGEMFASIGKGKFFFGLYENDKFMFDEIVEMIWDKINNLRTESMANYYYSIL